MKKAVRVGRYKSERAGKHLFVSFFLVLLPVISCWSQQLERKIIIENGTGYYTTIDPEFQIATLYEFELDKPIKTAKKYALPAGRNLSIPIIPFSWDIAGKDVFAINFMNNALNNRRNAIKRIPMNTLNEWNEKISISDVVEKSTEIQPYTSFEPYEYITDKSNILDHFFFDGIAISDSSFCFGACNNGELTLWSFANNKWEKGEDVKMKIDNPFNLFLYKKEAYLITDDGSIYAIKNNNIVKQPERSINKLLANGILIINKMNNTVYYIDHSKFDEQKSITEIIKNDSISIFL